MPSNAVRFPLLWGLREALWPLGLLALVVVCAQPALTVTWNGGADPVRSELAPAPSGPTPTALQMPVQGVAPSALHDSFTAPRSGGRTHHAIDIAAPAGTPVVAAADGIVLKRSSERLGGRSVYVLATDSSHAYYYAHLAHIEADVRRGARVSAGDVLGAVGTTGNAPADAPHLHFAVWALDDLQPPWADRPVNPYPLLTGAPPA